MTEPENTDQNVTDEQDDVTVDDQEAEEPPAPATSKAEGASSDTGKARKQDDWDRDRAMRTIREQRKAEKELKEQLADATRKVQEHERAKLSVQERLQKELEDARQQLTDFQKTLAERDAKDRQRNLQRTLAEAGEKVGAKRPSVLWRLVDLNDDELLEDGSPVEPDKVVARLRDDFPDLFRRTTSGAGDADAGAGKGKDQEGVTVDTWLRRAAGHR